MGGAERQALLLARALVRDYGANVEIWGLRMPGVIQDVCKREGIPCRYYPFTRPSRRRDWIKWIWRFQAELGRAGADVVLPYTYLPNVICGLCWRFAGARLCVWNQRDAGMGRLPNWLERWAVRLTPMFVSNSGHSARYLRDELHVLRRRAIVVHNGVEMSIPQMDRSSWRTRLGIKDETPVACMVANIHSCKDHATLIRAWRRVVDHYETTPRRPMLVLAGRRQDTFGSLNALVGELELCKHLRFLGFVDDISGLLSAVDVGVFSSQNEGLPNGLLECMAAGLPIVATDIPAIRECVGPENQMWLTPRSDDCALAERLYYLVTHKEIQKDLGSQNRRRVEGEFSSQVMCQRMTELIASGLDSSLSRVRRWGRRRHRQKVVL